MKNKRYLAYEEAPNFNLYDRKKLQVIWSRIDYLEKRILERKHSRDIQEVSALRWLLEFAGAPVPPENNDGKLEE